MADKRLSTETSISKTTGTQIGNYMTIEVIKKAFEDVLANVEVQIKHSFVDRIPEIIPCGDGNNGMIYQSPSNSNDNGSLYLMSTTDYNPISLILM